MIADTALGPQPTQEARRAGWSIRLPEHANAWHRLLLVLVLLGIWELLVQTAVFDRRFVAPPTEVTGGLWHIVRDGEVLASLRVTATATGYAVLLAAAVGLTLGFALGLSGFLHRTFMPVANILFASPKMVLTPFFVLFFGFGLTSKVVFAFTLGVFPVLFNAIEGVQSAPSALRRAATAMGASRTQILWRIIVPASVPSLMRGVRLGVNYSLLGVILAELYGATSGVALFIEHYTLRLERDRLFALFFLVSTLAIVLNMLLVAAERRLQDWRG